MSVSYLISREKLNDTVKQFDDLTSLVKLKNKIKNKELIKNGESIT